jgi:hypothetical protein
MTSERMTIPEPSGNVPPERRAALAMASARAFVAQRPELSRLPVVLFGQGAGAAEACARGASAWIRSRIPRVAVQVRPGERYRNVIST